jgi:hypothetical protein
VWLGSKSTHKKIEEIRRQHHKTFKPRYYRNVFFSYASLVIVVAGSFILASSRNIDFTAMAVFTFGLCLFTYSLKRLFNLGNEDDRAYFKKCILAASDRYELEEMGLDSYEHIAEIAHKEVMSDDITFAGMHPLIKSLHSKYNLRKLADEVEDYEK